MKRSVRNSIAATALAGAGVVMAAPAVFAYPVPSPSPSASPAADVTVTSTNRDGSVNVVVTVDPGVLKDGSTADVYAVPLTNPDVMRSSLLAASARSLANVRTAVAAVPANAIFLGTVVASASGAVSTPITVPASIKGKIQLLVVGINPAGKPVSVSTVVTIPGSTNAFTGGTGSGGSGGLAFTGSNSIVPLTLAGLGALALGSGAVVIARRRRSVTATDVAVPSS